jgi:hypothetical protein
MLYEGVNDIVPFSGLLEDTLSRPAKPLPWLSERLRKACAVSLGSFENS